MSRFRKAMAAWCFASLFVGSAFLGAFAVGCVNPPRPAASSPVVTVSPCSGAACVTFVLTYANVTFTNGLTATNAIWFNTTRAKDCLFIDGPGFCASKIPAAWPAASVSVSLWSPLASHGAVAIFTATAPTGAKVWFNLTGLYVRGAVVLLKNSAYYAQSQTHGEGNASFSWFVSSEGDPLFEIDVVPSSGGGGGGPPPLITKIIPAFFVERSFALFDAASDETVRFRDASQVPLDAVITRVWKFGDGEQSTEKDPVHRYSYSFSAVFNVTLLLCANDVCNMTMQSVSMIRWNTAILSMVIVGISFGGLALIVRTRKRRA